VASRSRHTRSTPQLPLATPEADPEKIVRKGKALREGTSTVEPGISDNFHCPSLETPISASHSPVIPSVGVSRTLNFGSVPVEFSPPGLGLEGETLVTPLSPEIVPWFRPSASEDFPTPGFTTPHPVVAATDGETSFPSGPLAFSSNPLCFPFLPEAQSQSPQFEPLLLLILLHLISLWQVLIPLETEWMP
jgi:hypothetical protein